MRRRVVLVHALVVPQHNASAHVAAPMLKLLLVVLALVALLQTFSHRQEQQKHGERAGGGSLARKV